MTGAGADGNPALPFVLIFLGASVGGLLIMALVVGIMVRVFTAGSRARPQVAADGSLVLVAHVFRPGDQFSPAVGWGSATYGTLAVTGRDLVWSDGAGGGWQVPVTSMAVTAVHGGFSLTSAPAVDVDIAGSGPWRLVVSDRSINRFMRNDAKRFREAAVARTLADTLVARGSRDLRRPPS